MGQDRGGKKPPSIDLSEILENIKPEFVKHLPTAKLMIEHDRVWHWFSFILGEQGPKRMFPY